MTIPLSQLNTRLIRNTDPSTASLINNLYDRGIIADFSEDGWVLYHKEWYPIATLLERIDIERI